MGSHVTVWKKKWALACLKTVPKTLCYTKDELKARITVAFNNLNEKNIGNARRRFQSHLQAVVEANSYFFWINLIYSISRYFNVILGKTSGKSKMSVLFSFLRNLNDSLLITPCIYNILGIIYIFFFPHTMCESTCDTLSSSAANQGW